MQLSPDLFSDFLTRNPGPIGVAVSGGSDSLALLVALVEAGVEAYAATVDHGLRPEAADEARHVGKICQGLKVPHEVLKWSGGPTKNIQADARNARYGLLADWAASHNLNTVALGHTLDDQAETFLMRLKRGSGVDGLSAMAESRYMSGVLWWRPLLKQKRQDLRQYLTGAGVQWIEDPSNADDQFERVRTRKALEVLASLGISADILAKTADRMARARAVLEAELQSFARSSTKVQRSGSVRLTMSALRAAEAENRYRLLAHALKWVSGQTYRPRFESLERLWNAMERAEKSTLHGCLVAPITGEKYEITREIKAMPIVSACLTYDSRWQCDPATGQIRPLMSDGLALCDQWTSTKETRAALEASPSLWRDGELLSAPFAGKLGPWQCRLKGGADSFFSSIVTH